MRDQNARFRAAALLAANEQPFQHDAVVLILNESFHHLMRLLS
jgi:hypothetical protein